MKKKILSMFLSLAIIWVISVPAFATNRNEIRILQDDDNFGIAQSISDDGVKYTAKFGNFSFTFYYIIRRLLQ